MHIFVFGEAVVRRAARAGGRHEHAHARMLDEQIFERIVLNRALRGRYRGQAGQRRDEPVLGGSLHHHHVLLVDLLVLAVEVLVLVRVLLEERAQHDTLSDRAGRRLLRGCGRRLVFALYHGCARGGVSSFHIAFFGF